MVNQDRSALADLFVRFQQPLYGYLFQLTGSADEAEDIFQEVLLAVWQGAKAFRGQAKVSSWIFRIAHHLALKARRDTERAVLDIEGIDQFPASEPTPEDQTIAHISYEALESGLQ